MWVNYHKHTSLSNVYTKDSPLMHHDYWDVLKQRYRDKPCVYTTVEHGWAGNYFHTYNLLEKYNKENGTNIQFVFGYEAYWVKDRHTNDNSNCHIILLARNDNGRKALNKILSIANKDGYYYRPRLDLELIMSLPPDDIMCATACIAYWNKYQDIDDITLQFADRFPHFYLEVQPHNTDKQKALNQHILDLSYKHNIPIIAGCDSHIIDESQTVERDALLESSGINYEDEVGWYLDYPTYEVLVERFQTQGILDDKQIQRAIDNTNELFAFEPIVLDRSLKVPVIKPLRDKTQEERNQEFERIVWSEWEQQKWDINQSKHNEYVKEIKSAIDEIEGCNMADYFILSYYIMKNGQEKYGGILTPTGRGSAVGMYINKLLQLTKVDKINSPVLMYPERFLTKERVLDSHTPPDVDNNVSSRIEFIQAQKELIGDLGTYDLLALGTFKLKAAWKMYARSANIEPQLANQISYRIDDYEKAVKYADGEEVNIEDYVPSDYLPLVEQSKKYLDIYDSKRGHACATICFDGDVESEIGVILCKSETTKKETLTAVIESGDIDSFGYLKQDYLIVDSIGLTYDVYKEAGIEPFTVNQLLEKIDGNKKVWDIYAQGLTQCVNQCEQPASTQKVMRYKPQNISELTQFIAAIRPGFKSMYHTFESRQHFEYGIKALDNLIQDEYRSSSFIIYQEDLMKVLEFAGFPISETYTIIKAISKKKEYVIKEAKPKFIQGFTQRIIDTYETSSIEQAESMANQVWQIVNDNSAYSFNSAHAYCMAIDSATIAYLKAYYPLEFYKCVLQRYTDKGDKDKVSLIKQEMLRRGYQLKDAKFGDDNRQFNIDRKNNCITQTLTSVKGMAKSTPAALYELGKVGIKTRSQLYQALIDNPNINVKAIDILFKLDYFSMFASPNKLIDEFAIYQKYCNSKVLSKSKLTPEEIEAVRPYCGAETEKQFKELNNNKIIQSLIGISNIRKTTTVDRIKYQLELLEYSTIKDISEPVDNWIVVNVERNNFGSAKVALYNICYGVMRTYRANKHFLKSHTLKSNDYIECLFQEKDKMRKMDDRTFKSTGEKIIELKAWKYLDKQG